MKALAAGLTLVNVATCAALFLGMAASGLSSGIAITALLFGLAAAVLAYCMTGASLPQEKPERTWFWIMAVCFGFFAFRSFCWLLFVDGNEMKVQSINNLGDLSLHLTYIRNFASGVALWPENPILFSSHIRYPAGTDLFNALLLLAGVDLQHGLIWAGLVGALATFYALYHWGGAFTVAGFLFNGGIAGLAFFQTGKLLDYQGVNNIAWKSLPLSMLVTQRGLLYALPAGLLLLCHWHNRHLASADLKTNNESRQFQLPFWVELSLYASLPLFHIHTFIALSLVAAFLFVIGEGTTRRRFALLVGTAFIPATFFVWMITDHFQARSLLEWKPGWVQHSGDFAAPFLRFWLLNFGLWPLFVLALIGLTAWRAFRGAKFSFREQATPAFLAPAALLFLFAWLIKTAPWEWDNIKLIIWAYLIMLPFLWRDLIKPTPLPVRIAVCLVLFSSGFISLLGGLLTNKTGFGVADRAEVDAVGVAVKQVPAEGRFAAYPTYNHPLLLQGRKVVLGYPGHIWTQGFEYAGVEAKLKTLMLGAPEWRDLARALHARYLFWGPDERTNYPGSKKPWENEAQLVAQGSWGEIYDLEGQRTLPLQLRQ